MEAEYLSVVLSLEDWVNLVNGQFYNYPAEGFYKYGTLQIKLGEAIFTGMIVNYAIMLTDATWGIGDPAAGEYAGLLEEFVITYSGTAKITFNPPGMQSYTVYIIDGKYVTQEGYEEATCTDIFACSPILVEGNDVIDHL